MIDLFIEWSKRPFSYGVTDCCQFVGACLERRTGENPARYFLYMSEKAADHLIDSYGGIDKLLTSVFGDPHSEPKDGDVALLDDQRVVGYVYDGRIITRTSTDSGLVDLPLTRATRFWCE